MQRCNTASELPPLTELMGFPFRNSLADDVACGEAAQPAAKAPRHSPHPRSTNGVAAGALGDAAERAAASMTRAKTALAADAAERGAAPMMRAGAAAAADADAAERGAASMMRAGAAAAADATELRCFGGVPAA